MNKRPEKFTDLGYSLNSIVNEIHPVTWREYLTRDDMDTVESNGVKMYSYSNCHYIVCDERVFCRVGYHGRNLFNDLQTNEGKQMILNKYQNYFDEFGGKYI